MTLVAGIDLGTTSVKGAVFELTSGVIRRASVPLSAYRPVEDQVEQNPDELARAVAQVLEVLWPFSAVAITGQVNTHVLVSDAGRAVTPAISWRDRRAAYVSDGRWGATSLISRLRWWQQQEPRAFEQARWAMVPRDYVLLRLTGIAATDLTSWPDLTCGDIWHKDLPAIARRLLPPPKPPVECVGSYRGAAIAVGCMDALAAAIGCGPTPPGTAIDVAGTSETVGLVCATADKAPAVRQVMQLPDGYWHAGPTQAGGLSLGWAQRLLRIEGDEALLALAGEASEPTRIVFLPYLEGERMPLWDPNLTAVLAGLTYEHDARHVARAVLEGVAFAVRHVLDLATPSGSPPAASLIICGGAARSGLWNQIKADVTGFPVEVPADVDTGVAGAAMLAACCLDAMDLAEARNILSAARKRLVPDPANAGIYEGLRGRYIELGHVIRRTGARR